MQRESCGDGVEIRDALAPRSTRCQGYVESPRRGGDLVWVGKSVRDPCRYYRLPDEG